MATIQQKYEHYVKQIVENGGARGKERIKPTDPQVKAIIERNPKCVICNFPYTSKPDLFEIHHVDGNANNSRTDNLTLIDVACHKQVHSEASRIIRDLEHGMKMPTIRPFVDRMHHSKTVKTDINQYKMVDCAYCNGTGRFGIYQDNCPVCKGLGENKVKKTAKMCVACDGTGKRGIYQIKCSVCKGTGYR